VRRPDAEQRLVEAMRSEPLSREKAWLLLSHLNIDLLPASELQDGAPFFRRCVVAWTLGASGDPSADPPDFLDPQVARGVRELLARAP
jgi:hypothetical protein